uniref:Nuclear receptor coactivator 2 n=1 Tax=Hippocampus comes TaxID=109280 RepID=A0A3Q3D979_HIPCM
MARCPSPNDINKKVSHVGRGRICLRCDPRARLVNPRFFLSVLRHGQAFSPIYRFSLSDGTIVSAHTKSKLVRSHVTNEPQLYMSVHILQREQTVCGMGQDMGPGTQATGMAPKPMNSSTPSMTPPTPGSLPGAGPQRVGLHSPSPVGMGGGAAGSHGSGYTSSSLSALQALSECHGVCHGHTLGSPDRRLGSPASAPPGSGAHPMSRPGPGSADSFEAGQSGHAAGPTETNPVDPKDEREDDAHSRLHDKGHTKLLQLLTNKPEPLETPLSPNGGSEAKEGAGIRGGLPGVTTHATSLKEKHKILHQLLQNSTSPVDLAKLTAEATGKELGQEQGQGAAGADGGPKQEPLSPKKKDNTLLRYLLDKDDGGLKDKAPKLEPGEVKAEGGKHPLVKTEKPDVGYDQAEQSSELDDILNDLQNAQPQLFCEPRPVSLPSPMDKQNIINDILQMSDNSPAAAAQHLQHKNVTAGMGPTNFGGVRPGPQGRAGPARSVSLEMSASPQYPMRTPSPYTLVQQQQQQQQSMVGGHGMMASQTNMVVPGLMGPGAPRPGMQQQQQQEGWVGSASTPQLAQGRMGPGGAPLRPGGPPGPRQMLQTSMMPNAQPDMDISMVSHFSQQQAPPNQTAPWPDSMMPIEQTAFVNQNRSLHPTPQEDLCSIGLGGGQGGPLDEGALMSQLYTALKDFDGLEELDRALGIPALVEQNQTLDQDQFPQDPSSMMLEQKPPMYAPQQFGPPPSHLTQRGYPGAPMQEPGFHPMAAQMPPRPGYPMMRMQARAGLRPSGVVANQPNTLRLQLQHRLQSQQNRQPMMTQMSSVSNVNLPLRSNAPNQGTINAQMLAQRQRELLSNHLRQRQQQQQQVQQQQQRSMAMRAQGLNLPPNMSSPRIPQANPQQFPYPPSYGMSQQAESGFGGPGAPPSPLLSPRVTHAQQSPMMQQGPGGTPFQGSPDINGWNQGNVAGSSMFSQQQASPQFTQQQQQSNSSMYNGVPGMAQMGVTSMSSPGLPSMGQEQVRTPGPTSTALKPLNKQKKK